MHLKLSVLDKTIFVNAISRVKIAVHVLMAYLRADLKTRDYLRRLSTNVHKKNKLQLYKALIMIV